MWCNCKNQIATLEARIAVLEKMGAGSMKVEDSTHLIKAIEENPSAFGKLSVWERNFISNIKEFTTNARVKWINVRQSSKLQEIYRRVM